MHAFAFIYSHSVETILHVILITFTNVDPKRYYHGVCYEFLFVRTICHTDLPGLSNEVFLQARGVA